MAETPFHRIAMVGAGAIGGWAAARLALAGNSISVLARGTTLEALRSGGLHLTEQGETTVASVTVDDDPSALGKQDVVLVAVKAPALADAAKSARPLIGPDTLVVPMLNGVPWWFTGEPLQSVDPDNRITQVFPLEQVIGCVVHASCRRAAPNHVEVVQAEKLIVGDPGGGASSRVASLCDLFERAGIRCEASESIRSAIWYKLWGNATINPLSALTRSTADKLLDDPVIRGFMAEAMDELAAIGAAIGCPIGETAEDRLAVTARLGAFKSSMLQDVEAGRPIELEALLGAPREIAARAGIATPQLDRIYAMTRLLGGNLGPP
ncbi:MAG: ketopantoate reductase family protein [Sphingomicrobium sp.]